MAKLSNIALPDATDKASRKNIPTIEVESEAGDMIARYNAAKDAKDQAEAYMKEMAPKLQAIGVTAVFDNNCEHAKDPKKIISSVNLADKLPEDAVPLPDEKREKLMCSWTKKDMKNDPATVEAQFCKLRTTADRLANINNYAAFEPVAEFDSEVFLVGGKFNQERYDTIMQALDEVSQELGVPNPLSCSKVLRPKADFHTIRWAMFDLEANLKIQAVLPTQINLKPIRPDNGVAAE